MFRVVVSRALVSKQSQVLCHDGQKSLEPNGVLGRVGFPSAINEAAEFQV